jgi:hypothetical protein
VVLLIASELREWVAREPDYWREQFFFIQDDSNQRLENDFGGRSLGRTKPPRLRLFSTASNEMYLGMYACTPTTRFDGSIYRAKRMNGFVRTGTLWFPASGGVRMRHVACPNCRDCWSSATMRAHDMSQALTPCAPKTGPETSVGGCSYDVDSRNLGGSHEFALWWLKSLPLQTILACAGGQGRRASMAARERSPHACLARTTASPPPRSKTLSL